MSAPEKDAAYPPDQSAGYPAQTGQPGYPTEGYGYPSTGYPTQGYEQPQQGYSQPLAGKPGVDAYGQPTAAPYPSQPSYPQQPPAYQQQPYQTQAPPVYQHTAATVVVAQQPTVVAQVQPGIKPNNYLILSIVNLLFCFFILGIIALIFSLQVDSAWSSGRYHEAQRHSNNARILNYIGIGLGIAGWVIVGIIVIVRIVLSVVFI